MATLLFIGGGVEMTPAIPVARELGLRVAITDQRADAPGMLQADYPLVASIYSIEDTIAAVRTVPGLTGCIAVGHDAPCTVAAVQEAYRLPVTVSPEQATLVIDKFKLKDQLRQAGINVPSNGFCSDDEWGIIKPPDSRGGRGVFRVNPKNEAEVSYYFNESLRLSLSKQVLVEEWIEGPQYSVEAIVYNAGKTRLSFVSGRNYEYLERYAPYIIENGGDLPPIMSSGARQAIGETMGRLADALFVSHGTLKADLVWSQHDHKFYVIEATTGRLSGGYFCTHEIPLAYGYNFVRNAILLALGETPAEMPVMGKHYRRVCQRYIMAPKAGVVTKACSTEWDRDQFPGVVFVDRRFEVGDQVRPPQSHADRLGCIITTGLDYGGSRRAADAIVAHLLGQIEIDEVCRGE